MYMGVTWKHEVEERIEDLPEDERSRARELYNVLDGIEWSIVAPRYLGVFGVFVLFVLNDIFADTIPTLLGEGEVFIIAIATLASYGLGVLFLKKAFFNARRKVFEKRLRKMLSSGPVYRRTLDIILELDPDIERTIKKPLSHAIAAAKQPYSHYSDIS